MKTASIVFAASILASSMPVAAHHSWNDSYLLDKTSTVEGTIVLFDFRIPHSFFEDFHYGMREFAIFDNNGYLLQFVSPLP